MDVLGTVINCVLLVLTFAVVWFAWQTVRESRNATTAAQETVTAIGKLLTVAQETAASSAASGKQPARRSRSRGRRGRLTSVTGNWSSCARWAGQCSGSG